MSAPDDAHGASDAGRRLPQAAQRYGTIVVVGGGCYGAYYVRQLGRAARAGAIVAERVLVVDRDPGCRVALHGWDAQPGEQGGVPALEAGTRRSAGEQVHSSSPDDAAAATSLGGPPPEKHVRAEPRPAHHPLPALVIETADWRDFFPSWLAGAAAAPAATASDAIVPSPLMPHLMYEWLLGRARERWPGRSIETRPLPAPPSMPWERAAPDGTHYVSFATWMCPINCIEPARCPHTRGPRTWSLPPAVRQYAESLASAGTTVAGPVVLHCVHRAWGVGMFDVADVLAGDATVAAAGASGPAAVLVGTVSHCHGALNLLHLG
jgi:hypothetical protein